MLSKCIDVDMDLTTSSQSEIAATHGSCLRRLFDVLLINPGLTPRVSISDVPTARVIIIMVFSAVGTAHILRRGATPP